MPSINDVYGSGATLKAADLPAGVQVPVIIKEAKFVEFDDGNKIELTFVGKEKVLICNKTNANRIAEMHGEDYELWNGKSISLQQDIAEFQGKSMPCVRVVPKSLMVAQPVQQAAPQPVAAAPLAADEIPF